MRLSVRLVFVAVLFITLFTISTREVVDPDFWWHLRTGQYIAETHSIPRTDPFSYISQGKEWVTHEWLSELLLYGIYRVGGLGLLSVVFGLIITAAFWLVYLRSAAKPYIAGFVTLLGAIATAPTWGVRPQMLSLLLAALFLYLLNQYFEKEKTKFVVVLPALMILWVNLHAGYALGLGIIGIYLLGKGAEKLVAERKNGVVSSSQSSWKQLGILAVILGACTAAVLINPNGARMFTYPFETLNSTAMQTYIQEWFSPNFHAPEWQPLAWLILSVIAAGLFSKRSASLTEIALMIIFEYAALRSMRNVYLFAIVAVPVLTDQLSAEIKLNLETSATNKMMGTINALLVGCILLVAGVRVISVLQNQQMAEEQSFPVEATNWIIRNKPAGNVFNAYNWGGYLIWRLYPQYLVYIDGRADVHGDAEMSHFSDVYNGIGWQKDFATHDIRIALVEPNSPIASALQNTPNWQIVYLDKQSELLIRK